MAYLVELINCMAVVQENAERIGIRSAFLMMGWF
jgi:hypothetical protein